MVVQRLHFLKRTDYRQRWQEALELIEGQQQYLDGLEDANAKLSVLAESARGELGQRAAEIGKQMTELRARMRIDARRRRIQNLQA